MEEILQWTHAFKEAAKDTKTFATGDPNFNYLSVVGKAEHSELHLFFF